MTLRPFQISVPEEDLLDLRARLDRTRWTDGIAGRGWEDGADIAYLQELCSYWRSGFDWRAQERRLNALPQFRTRIDGHDVHFVHVRSAGANARPLLMTHGWPSTVAEFYRIIPMLTEPQRFGGDADDNFDVVAPSLPGFGFSSRPAQGGVASDVVTGLWARLMTDILGYDQFFAHGGDIGAGVTNRLGRERRSQVRAIHVLSAPIFDLPPGAPVSDAEREWFVRLAVWERDDGGYAHQQRSRPQTLAVGLNDSPAGLAAWIIDKWRNWSDCDGDPESVFSKDALLTQVSIYWLTRTIGSSVRMYYETAHASPPSTARIETPARLFLTKEEVNRCPIEWAERCYANLSYGLAAAGGHFLAAEQPEILAADLREFFRPFR